MIPGVRVVKEKMEAETSWFGVPIICEDGPVSTSKQALVKHLENNKVQTRNYFAGNILRHPGYKDLGNAEDFPTQQRHLMMCSL